MERIFSPPLFNASSEDFHFFTIMKNDLEERKKNSDLIGDFSNTLPSTFYLSLRLKFSKVHLWKTIGFSKNVFVFSLFFACVLKWVERQSAEMRRRKSWKRRSRKKKNFCTWRSWGEWEQGLLLLPGETLFFFSETDERKTRKKQLSIFQKQKNSRWKQKIRFVRERALSATFFLVQ